MEMNQTVKLGLSLLILVSATSNVAAAAHEKGKTLDHIEKDAGVKKDVDCEERLLEPLVQVKASDPDYFGGLTPRGFERVKNAMAALKHTSTAFDTNFEGLRSIGDMDLLTMATRENAMILGPPGGAKSAHLMWLIKNIWYKMMNELDTPAALFGAQTRKGIEEGIELRNDMHSIANSEYALVDEWSNANPMVAGALLSFMNPGERFTSQNGVRIPAKTRAVFTTGNATRAQLLLNYTSRGLFTGPALLNRSIYKAWQPNWLTLDEQFRRDAVIKRQRHLNSVLKYGSMAEQDEAKRLLQGLDSQHIDMYAVEAFAEHAFVVHEDLEAAVREFANLFRVEMNKKIFASDAAHREDPNKEPLVKTPSAEWTERFRTSLMKTVIFSAALDYLRLATPQSLDPKVFKKPIILKPMSLWRVAFASTTMGPGENRFNPQTGQIVFNLTRNNEPKLTNMVKVPDRNDPISYKQYMLEGCKDAIEKAELEFMLEEQDLTNTLITKVNGILKAQAKDLAPYMPTTEDALLGLDDNAQDFEIMNYRALEAQRPSIVPSMKQP